MNIFVSLIALGVILFAVLYPTIRSINAIKTPTIVVEYVATATPSKAPSKAPSKRPSLTPSKAPSMSPAVVIPTLLPTAAPEIYYAYYYAEYYMKDGYRQLNTIVDDD